MKKICEEVDLSGKLETISMMELRKSPGEVIDSILLGKTFIIERNGKPMGVLSKFPGVELSMAVDPEGKISWKLPS